MSLPDVPQDDPNIPDMESLYRSIHPRQVHDEVNGPRPSSAAFGNVDPSVDRESLCSPQQTLERMRGHVAVATLLAGGVREIAKGIASHPIEGNPAHAVIISDRPFIRSQWAKKAKKLANICQWAIAPPPQ
jgi:hypothetical protein